MPVSICMGLYSRRYHIDVRRYRVAYVTRSMHTFLEDKKVRFQFKANIQWKISNRRLFYIHSLQCTICSQYTTKLSTFLLDKKIKDKVYHN
ncbi:hypothetical protein KM620_gp005 [Hyposidra talaca nucleopolyhedrovirus]|uniref:Uncharacterized protein n=1 Tax=Hyposidra talaca nucleopolyhedrovirus TaxID=1070315 RepID=A0A2Z4HHW5_9ABAC|nr:hypothetical protein KM620_gp005 [Hyposidra talaca nucleopolyhedrovirus]AWW14365.1 hypothetical protein HytaNPV_gp005 [Hyposidra talaca nucleopolyhedrovirus]